MRTVTRMICAVMGAGLLLALPGQEANVHGQQQPARNEKGSEAQKKSRDARTSAVLIAIDVVVLRQLRATRSLIHLDTSLLYFVPVNSIA